MFLPGDTPPAFALYTCYSVTLTQGMRDSRTGAGLPVLAFPGSSGSTAVHSFTPVPMAMGTPSTASPTRLVGRVGSIRKLQSAWPLTSLGGSEGLRLE